MTTFTEVRIPREIVNDDVVTIAAWEVPAGSKVHAKQIICSLETSKAVVDVEAEADGYLEILFPKGSELPIGELIGRILAEPPLLGHGTARPASSTASPQADGAATAVAFSPRISKKAQLLIEQNAIDPSVFVGLDLVRESEVSAYLQRQNPAASVSDDSRESLTPPTVIAEPVTPTETATQQTGSSYAGKHGFLHDARVSSAERGGASLVTMAINYLWRNWFLGNLVRWAPRGAILAIHRMRGVTIGKDCYIDPNAIIETAYPENVTIGNDVRVTARAIIMTHIKAPHYMRDSGVMPLVLKPVVLEDHTFIGVNSIIMPGVTVGKASVVASGAVVLNNVPPFTMVAGNPAKVIKTFRRP